MLIYRVGTLLANRRIIKKNKISGSMYEVITSYIGDIMKYLLDYIMLKGGLDNEYVLHR